MQCVWENKNKIRSSVWCRRFTGFDGYFSRLGLNGINKFNKFQCKRWGDSRSKIGKIENQYGWIVFFSFFFFFSLQFMHIELNFCVCRIIRNSTSIFIFCQTHVSVFSPSIAPPILQDPFGWRVSNDQHSVIHHVRTTNFVIVDSFAVNQNRSYDWKKKKRENIEREKKRRGMEKEKEKLRIYVSDSLILRDRSDEISKIANVKLPFSSETQVHWLTVRCRFRLIVA